ncbi:MAG: hypothetical protein IPK17_39545 [Chloroflexi bacterium]|uniref:hypothetical protein n=1 Tax=Candidatus Flexifilum breve TaxID=3140694 RepID=UPI0031356208|nr:hypothetical protein [Chloroflexota bacterium]
MTFSQILLREPDPLVFHLFGDESIGRGVVVYGIIVFNLSDVNAAAEDFRNLISSYGLPPETRFHCREVFAGDARNKTSWRHMSEKQVWEVAEQLLLKLNTHRPQYCLGIVYRDAFPSVLASGSGSKRIDVQEEHLYPLAFAGALQPLVDLELVSPDIESHLWFDPLNKKLEFWGAGALQVQRVFSHNNLIIEKVDDGKPLLLDAADIFSYVAGRAVSREDSRHKAKCQELLGLCHPRIGIGSWIPP